METIAAVRSHLRRLGTLLGRAERAAALIDSLDHALAGVTASVRGRERVAVYYSVWHDPPQTTGPGTFIDEVIEHAGGRNVFADATRSWPRVSVEAIVRRNPDALVIARHAPDAVGVPWIEGPGWRDLEAVRNGPLPRGRRGPVQSPRAPGGRGGPSHGPLPARPGVTATPRRLVLLAVVVVVASAFSVSFGASGLGPGDLWRALSADGDPTARSILLQLRLPRAALAALVGGALGLSGCTFQALLRNPLAEPYVLGVSGGAAVGAVAVVVSGIGVILPWTLPVGAFLGAVAAMALVLGVARRASPGRMDTRVLILSGVIIGAFFNAMILLMLSIADVESFRSAIFWMMGNLSGADWGSTALLAVLLVPAGAAVLSLARAFNLLSRGEEVAHYLGASVQRVKLSAYLAASLMVAAAVAAAGRDRLRGADRAARGPARVGERPPHAAPRVVPGGHGVPAGGGHGGAAGGGAGRVADGSGDRSGRGAVLRGAADARGAAVSG